MKTIAKAFQNIGPIRLAIMGGVITGLIAFFIFLVTSISSPEMQRLYGELEKADSNKLEAPS